MPFRRFTDREGTVWDVWDTVPSQPTFVGPMLSQGWLTFLSRASRRRLAPVPMGWESSRDDHLELFCREAEAVRFR